MNRKNALPAVGVLVAIFVLSPLWIPMLWPRLTGGLSFTYIQRLLQYPQNDTTEVSWYEGLETIPGAPTPSEIPKAPSPFSQQALDDVSSWAEGKESRALLVGYKGALVYEKYWQNHQPDSWSNSHSMAKSVLGLLFGIAIKEGHIRSVNDTLATYFPHWRDDERGLIPLKYLLRMQSGLARYDDKKDPFSDILLVHLGVNMLPTLVALPQQYPAGRRHRYNNLDSQLLGIALQNATGETYANYLQTRLWEPLGASPAALWPDHQGQAHTYCCFFAQARDWLRLGFLWLDKGRAGENEIVPETWLGEMASPSEIADYYGYQVWLSSAEPPQRKKQKEEMLDKQLVKFDGRSRQRVYIAPTYDLVVVRIGEKPREWEDTYLPNRLIRDLQSP